MTVVSMPEEDRSAQHWGDYADRGTNGDKSGSICVLVADTMWAKLYSSDQPHAALTLHEHRVNFAGAPASFAAEICSQLRTALRDGVYGGLVVWASRDFMVHIATAMDEVCRALLCNVARLGPLDFSPDALQLRWTQHSETLRLQLPSGSRDLMLNQPQQLLGVNGLAHHFHFGRRIQIALQGRVASNDDGGHLPSELRTNHKQQI